MRTARRVRVAVVDSGVYAEHPHVGGIAGGIAIDTAGLRSDDWIDRLGHGTAVAAAIREKAPQADLYAVRIFGDRLSTRASSLVAGINWAVEIGAHVVNLSLGTSNQDHAPLFAAAIERAVQAGAVIVAARDDNGMRWLPGSLSGVVGVQMDTDCPRDQFRAVKVDGAVVFRASGFARPIPGIDPRRNLNGISFAVANISGFLARAISEGPFKSAEEAVSRLAWSAQMPEVGTLGA